MCQDKVINYLNAIRYNAVLMPREQFDPLMVFGGDSDDLHYLGSLEDLVASESALTPITRDDQAPNISGRRTDKLEAKVGVDLLGRLFQAIGGGSIKAAAQDQQSGGFEVILLNVLHDFVAPLKIASYLANARLRDGIAESLVAYKTLYLVSETLKSNQFGVVAFDGNDSGAQLSAEAIQGLISASASIEVTKGSGGSMCYKGDKQLRFAFRALPLAWSETDGSVRLGVDNERLVARAEGDTPLDVFPVIAPRSLLDLRFDALP
jgi:hypothetical protein